MSYYLYLEDDPERPPAIAANYIYPFEIRFLYRMEEWHIVRSYDEFVAHIVDHGMPKCVSLDHDLGKDAKTGYDACVWLLDYCVENNIKVPQILCHSWNPDGKDRIMNLIRYIKNL